jgi:hypothetical protein
MSGRRVIEKMVDRLIDEGVTLAPCDWGYCVYAQAFSACGGDSAGPNPVERAPDVCGKCTNFVVTERHRSWWEERVRDASVFLSHQGLTGQSIAVIERRRDTAEQILRKLNVAHQRSLAMSENKEKSAVLIRLEAAISLHETEHPGKPISISQLCKQAGVNRAISMQVIPSCWTGSGHRSTKIEKMNEGRRSFDSESEEIERLRLQNKALLYLCVELQASMTDLEKQISHLRSKSNSRQRK